MKRFLYVLFVTVFTLAASVGIEGCSENSTDLEEPDATAQLHERDLIHDGVLQMPRDFEGVIAEPETIRIDVTDGVTSISNSRPPIRRVVLPDGSEIELTYPIVNVDAGGIFSQEDVARIQRRLNGAASPQTIRYYTLHTNEWVTALCLDMTDQAWVIYYPNRAGNRTLKFRNGMSWNTQVFMLPHWKNSQPGWHQWDSWWVAPWWQYKNLYSGSADIAFLFVVVQGNDVGASVPMTVY